MYPRCLLNTKAAPRKLAAKCWQAAQVFKGKGRRTSLNLEKVIDVLLVRGKEQPVSNGALCSMFKSELAPSLPCPKLFWASVFLRLPTNSARFLCFCAVLSWLGKIFSAAPRKFQDCLVRFSRENRGQYPLAVYLKTDLLPLQVVMERKAMPSIVRKKTRRSSCCWI